MSTRLDGGFDGRIVVFTHVLSSRDRDWERTGTSPLRLLGVDELNRFLSEAGLMVEARFGDQDRSPLAERSAEIITVARRA